MHSLLVTMVTTTTEEGFIGKGLFSSQFRWLKFTIGWVVLWGHSLESVVAGGIVWELFQK